jgi:hypothetical protein
MVTQHNKAAAAGSVSASQVHRGWTNVPAQQQETATVVISDRSEKGGQNVPPQAPK